MADLMENRRLQGKESINKKLKMNQEFSMKNTLSPQAPIWTKWHQQRLLESEMDKDLSSLPNHKYISVSYKSTSINELSLDHESEVSLPSIIMRNLLKSPMNF